MSSAAAYPTASREACASNPGIFDWVQFVSINLRDDPYQGKTSYAVDPTNKYGEKHAELASSLNFVPGGVRLAGFEIGGGGDPQQSGILKGRGVFNTPRFYGPKIHEINVNLAREGKPPVIIRPLIRGDVGVGLKRLHPDDLYWTYGTMAEEFGASFSTANGIPPNHVIFRLFNAQNCDRIGDKLVARSLVASIMALSRIKKEGFIDQLRLLQGEDVKPVRLNIGLQPDFVFSNDPRFNREYFLDNARVIQETVEEYSSDLQEGFGSKDMKGGKRTRHVDAIFPSLMSLVREGQYFADHSHYLGRESTDAAIQAGLTAIEHRKPIRMDVGFMKGGGFPYVLDVASGIAQRHGLVLPPRQIEIFEEANDVLKAQQTEYNAFYIKSGFFSHWQIDYSASAQGGEKTFLDDVVTPTVEARAKELARRENVAIIDRHRMIAQRQVADLAVHVSHEVAIALTGHKVTPAMALADRISRQLTLLATTAPNGKRAMLDEMLDMGISFHRPLTSEWREKIRAQFPDLVQTSGLLQASAEYFVKPMPLVQDPAIMVPLRKIIFDNILPPDMSERTVFRDGPFANLTPETYQDIRTKMTETYALDREGARVFLTNALLPYADRNAIDTAVNQFVAKYVGIDETWDVPDPVLPRAFALVQKKAEDGTLAIPVRDAVAATMISGLTPQGAIDAKAVQSMQFPADKYPYMWPTFRAVDYPEGALRSILTIYHGIYEATKKPVSLDTLQETDPKKFSAIAMHALALDPAQRAAMFTPEQQKALSATVVCRDKKPWTIFLGESAISAAAKVIADRANGKGHQHAAAASVSEVPTEAGRSAPSAQPDALVAK